MAWALLTGLTRIAEVVHDKSFYSYSSAQNVTVLPANRFAVADRSYICIYRIERNGKLVFESRAYAGDQPDKGIGVVPKVPR